MTVVKVSTLNQWVSEKPESLQIRFLYYNYGSAHQTTKEILKVTNVGEQIQEC
jgi:hypothetical protein